MDLLTASALEIAAAIRRREISPLEAVEGHLTRIQQVNPWINAMVEPRYEEALAEARAATERIAQQGTDGLPSLFGVPVTVKDTYAMAGLPHCVGMEARRGKIAPEDATLVKRLKEQGAIVLGKTNAPEAGMWMETYNKVYGLTRNPNRLDRSAGGSSGGEGALIAAGGSPLGIGSDVGGSIRLPSGFNGIVGHKPTGGFCPGTGHFLPVHGEIHRYCVFGPMARRVEDLVHAMTFLTGPDGIDPSVEKRAFKPRKNLDPKRLKVRLLPSLLSSRPDYEVQWAVEQAGQALADAGAKVIPWWPRGIGHGPNIWSAAMTLADAPTLAELLREDQPYALWREVLRWPIGQSVFSTPIVIILIGDWLGRLVPGFWKRFLPLRDRLQAEIEAELGEDGVMIAPIYPTVAPKHHHTWTPNKLNGIAYCGTFNILELPSTVVPIYRTHEGLPAAVQIIGKRWNDATTLKVAALLEEHFGGWQMATPGPARKQITV